MKLVSYLFLILSVAAPLQGAIADPAKSEPRIISASLELRTQISPPALKVVERIRIEFPPELILRGFIRKFEISGGPFFGASTSKRYEFQSLTRQIVSPTVGEVIDLPLAPEVSTEEVAIKFGNNSYLVAGVYEYVIEYLAFNFLQSSAEKKLEGFMWFFLREFPYPKDVIKVAVYPPDFVEPRSVQFGWSTLSSDSSDEISFSKLNPIKLERHLFERNTLGEGRPYGQFSVPNGIKAKESLVIRMAWPLGFVFKGP